MAERNLHADLAICEAVKPGPWKIETCKCGYPSCTKLFVTTISYDGRMEPEDACFIAEARTGWEHAIRRAIAAEAEVERLNSILSLIPKSAIQIAVLRIQASKLSPLLREVRSKNEARTETEN
jgi:hypothetical protein